MTTDRSMLAFEQGLEFRSRHRWKAAIACFARALDGNPAWADARFWLAVSLDNSGQERQAIPHYRAALAAGLPPDLEQRARAWLASSLLKTGAHEDALAAIALVPAEVGYGLTEECRRIRTRIERQARRAGT